MAIGLAWGEGEGGGDNFSFLGNAQFNESFHRHGLGGAVDVGGLDAAVGAGAGDGGEIDAEFAGEAAGGGDGGGFGRGVCCKNVPGTSHVPGACRSQVGLDVSASDAAGGAGAGDAGEVEVMGSGHPGGDGRRASGKG